MIRMVYGPVFIYPAFYFTEIVNANESFCYVNRAITFEDLGICSEGLLEEQEALGKSQLWQLT